MSQIACLIQGESDLVCQLCQLITLAYVYYIKYPFTHLILYMGDFVWHIECIDGWLLPEKNAYFYFLLILSHCEISTHCLQEF